MLMESLDPQEAHAARRNLLWLTECVDADGPTNLKARSKG
jgi:hypothetical protein